LVWLVGNAATVEKRFVVLDLRISLLVIARNIARFVARRWSRLRLICRRRVMNRVIGML